MRKPHPIVPLAITIWISSTLTGCELFSPPTPEAVSASSADSWETQTLESNSEGGYDIETPQKQASTYNHTDMPLRGMDVNDALLRENARLMQELQQRGIDVRESERGVVINLPDVLFTFGRYDLTPAATEVITEIAQVLQRAPSRQLLVEGHTDSVGTIEYNYHLSNARARAVFTSLEKNGISPSRISVHAFGETTPIATNRTEDGRRRNRRVEVIIEN